MDDFLAGSISGFSQTLIGHPFDTLKVNFQNNPRTTFHSFQFRDLWRGLMYPMGFSILTNAVAFSSSSFLSQLCNHNHYVSGFLSGILVSPIVHFQDIGKINRQLGQPITLRSFQTLRGIHVSVLRESTALSIYFGSYYSLREQGYNPYISGGFSGWLNWTLTYPIDVIRGRVYGQCVSMKHAFQQGQLWRGYTLCATRAILVNSVGFAVYESVLEQLKKGY